MAVSATIAASPGIVDTEGESHVTLAVTNGGLVPVALRGLTPFATPIEAALALGQPALPMWTVLGAGETRSFFWGAVPHAPGVFSLSAKLVLGTKEEIYPSSPAGLVAIDDAHPDVGDGLLDAVLDAPLA